MANEPTDEPSDEPTADEPTANEPTADDATTDDATETDATENTEPQAAVDDESPDEDATESVEEPTAASAGESTNGEQRAGVFIPHGVAILLGVLLLIGLVGGGGFALGRSTADDDGDRETRALPFGAGNGPQSPNNGNGNGNNDNGNNGNGNGGAPNNDGRELPFDDQPSPAAGAFLGVRIDDATGDTSGAQILLVATGSPAADAGLEPGDIIMQVNDDEILGASDLVDAIADQDPGDTVTITFLRDGDTETVEVELADPSSTSNRSNQPQPSQSN